MEKKKLFENESDSDSENEVKIKYNEEYAKSYNKFRQKEFIKKFKDQDSDSDTDSEESDSTEDEKIDPEFDKEFFKTLSSLKSKDPKIYDKSTKFFENLENDKDADNNSKNTKLKPLMLKDYERKIILEKGGKYEDDESENETKEKRPQSPSYVEEQKNIKAEIKKILNDSDEDEDGFGSIFQRRVKSKDEADQEEEDYVKWLAGQKEEIEETTKDTLKPLKQYWDNPKLPRNEKFLRDYVLNKGYIDTQVHDIPTYEEIIADTDLSEDENELQKQAEFEQKYNFRYEEPDQEFIKRYPRTIENSVRRSDDSRKKKRQEAKERKEKEKAEKMKELEMLKEMKRQEIEEKINKLKEVTGNEVLPFKDEDLESEFDPDAHDKRMQEIFNDEYYQVDEGEEKPDCPDIEELKIEDWDNFDPDKDIADDFELNCENPEFNMDCDYEANAKEKLQKELIASTRDKRSRRRRNRFMEMIKKEKPVFDPEDEKTYAEYIEEYYKMDCEDFIGDAPCRFKYVECEPNDFGLTIEEILLAKNKELNQWASLKKAVQIRPSHLDKKERRIYQMKAKNEELKKKIFKSLYGEQSEEEEEEDDGEKPNINGEIETNQNNIQNNETKVENKKKRKKKKKKTKSNVNNESIADNTNVLKDNTTVESENISKSSKKRKRNDSGEKNIKNSNSQDELNSKSYVSVIENKKIVLLQEKEIKEKLKSFKNDKTDNFDSSETIKKIKPTKSKTKTSIKVQEDVTVSQKNKAENVEKLNNIPEQNINKKFKVSKQNQNNSQGSVNNAKTKSFSKEKMSKGNKFKKVNENTNGISKKSKTINKNHFKQFNNTKNKQISDERLKAYGINPKKFHKKKNFNNKNFSKKDGNKKNKNNPFS